MRNLWQSSLIKLLQVAMQLQGSSWVANTDIALGILEKNTLQHLRELRCNNEKFKEEYDAWIYSCQSVEEFEDTWLDLKTKYQIDDSS